MNPLVLVYLPKQVLTDIPGSIEFNNDYTGIYVNNIEIANHRVVPLFVSLDEDFDSSQTIWDYDAISVFDAQISEPLTFNNGMKKRVVAVTLGRNAQGVPRLNYGKVWTYVVPET